MVSVYLKLSYVICVLNMLLHGAKGFCHQTTQQPWL